MTKEQNEKIWDLVLRAMVPLSITAGGWLVSSSVNNSTNIKLLEETKISYEEARQMETRIIESMPPPWLKEDIQEIKTILKDMGTRINSLERNSR
jgi:hypothetical protein